MTSPLRWFRRFPVDDAEFRRIVRPAVDVLLIVDEQGRVVDTNDQTTLSLGYSRNELLTRSVTAFALDFELSTLSVIRSYPAVSEGRMRTKEGFVFPAEIRLTRLQSTWRKPRYVVAARDLRDRKAFETELERRHRRFKAIVDALGETQTAVLITDAQSQRVVFMNDMLCDLSGYTREELLRLPWLVEVVAPEDRERLLEYLRLRLERRPAPERYEISVFHKNGHRLEVEVGVRPIEVEGCLQVVSILRDISERQRAARELAQARDAALEASRLQSMFLTNINHEIRTPLNVILGYNSLIAERLESLRDPDLDDAIRVVNRASVRLLHTIQTILDMALIETGRLKVMPRRLSIQALIEGVLSEFRPLAAQKGLELIQEIEAPRVEVVFDEYCLTQALRHLIDNAVKFTERGRIWVGVLNDPERGPRVEVQDTGIGISPEYLRQLFAPFSQEDTGLTRRYEGPGLGLALTRRYLELNGASIRVESEKGNGTRVEILLEAK